jgi:hypothetical protein
MHKKLSCLLVNAITVTGAISSQNVSSPETVHRGAEVSTVAGKSWIKHLNKPFEETTMGRTGYLGPAPGQGGAVPDSPKHQGGSRVSDAAFAIHRVWNEPDYGLAHDHQFVSHQHTRVGL